MSIPWDIHSFDCVLSTQETAKQYLKHGNVIHAHTQTQGKGRHGRIWVSEGGNLFMSLVIGPLPDAHDVGHYSFLTAIALYQAICDYSQSIQDDDIILKWPNDVLYQGRKCAGILLEYEDEHLVIGIGVNTQHAPAGASFLPGLDNNILRDQFLHAFSSLYEESFEHIRKAWLSHAHPVGTELSVSQGGRDYKGTFAGLTDDGCLQLKRIGSDEIDMISSGDVFLVPADDSGVL